MCLNSAVSCSRIPQSGCRHHRRKTSPHTPIADLTRLTSLIEVAPRERLPTCNRVSSGNGQLTRGLTRGRRLRIGRRKILPLCLQILATGIGLEWKTPDLTSLAACPGEANPRPQGKK